MAFDIIRGVTTGTDWSRGGESTSIIGAKLEGDGKPNKILLYGAIAGAAAVGGFLAWKGFRGGGRGKHVKPRPGSQTFIMTKTPSGRIYAGPMADFYGRKAA